MSLTNIERLIIIIMLLLWTLNTRVANAVPRPKLNIYYEQSTEAIPVSYLPYVTKKIRRHFKEEFNVVPRMFIKGVSPSPIPRTLDRTREHFSYWYKRIANSRKKHHWALVITSRFEKDGLQYFAGLGNATCFKFERGLTLSIMSMYHVNAQGEDRLRYSVYGAMHELGHNLGLDHLNTEPATIMHSAVLRYSNQDLHFNADQKWRASVCFRMRS